MRATSDTGLARLIDEWFPCAAVDEACKTPAGSGKNEKSIFTWFASRPIAQARAAVVCALLGDGLGTRETVEKAVRGDRKAIDTLATAIAAEYPEGRPVVLDVFSGRGIIPLESARLGATSVGLDLSPVATLAGRLLADYPLRDWNDEPPLPWVEGDAGTATLEGVEAKPRLVADLRVFLREVGLRVEKSVELYYPRNRDGSFPWGYLWAISIPCDGCERRFPLLGSLVLRHPYGKRDDPGQALKLVIDGDKWRVNVVDGIPEQAPTYSSAEKAGGKKQKGKSARCPFCGHVHSLETVKAKGFAGEYRDGLLIAADIDGEGRKIFRELRPEDLEAIGEVDLAQLEGFGPLSAVPDEPIPQGNVHTVMASGYGYRTFGSLMCDRQTLSFVETVRAIRACHAEVLEAGASTGYARSLASFAAATLVRRIRRSTRGAKVLAHGSADGSKGNTVQTGDLFSSEASILFQFDWFEAGPGGGPGTWASVVSTGLKPYETHISGLRGQPARLRVGSAMALPYRDGSVDFIVTDPPYYDMIEYADASDLFYVWLKRILFDIEPDLFGPDAPNQSGLQNKNDEIIVRRVQEPDRVVHDKEFYERSLAAAFREARRVLRPDGHLVVVFGHSDPDAWKRLLVALHEAGFVVTSSWPSRSEAGETGVASIKVTVTIGCRVAPSDRTVATAAEVDRGVVQMVRQRVQGWNTDGLALVDQMMAAYGPAMEVYGRYSAVLQPDGATTPIERYLTLARKAVRDAATLRLDELPLETFDPLTRFAVFWMRLYGRTTVPKGEARFMAQADNLRLDEVRGDLLVESGTGFRLVLNPPKELSGDSSAFDVVRATTAAYAEGGVEAAAEVLAVSERAPDDEHTWAVVGELVSQLPASDGVAKNLAAVQRNASVIKNLAKGIAQSRADLDPAIRPKLFSEEEASQ